MSNTLILIRHGKSVWNVKNIFTGWVDVELDDLGKKEALKSALLLKEAEIVPSFAFTSFLKRAQNTLQIILEELNIYNLHTETAWELNERHYGALQGLNKDEVKKNMVKISF
jgi:2,3-bisphosphoglycerate-dependent phosphoglycerate mutase